MNASRHVYGLCMLIGFVYQGWAFVSGSYSCTTALTCGSSSLILRDSLDLHSTLLKLSERAGLFCRADFYVFLHDSFLAKNGLQVLNVPKPFD